MTFLIEKIIDTELFIAKTVALFIGETLIKVWFNEGDQQVLAIADWRSNYALHRNAILT